MKKNDISIRKAQLQDVEDIFWLLHSESIPWSMEQIKAENNNLHVMTCENKLIGVTYCHVKDDRTEFLWTAIHPLYPEKALSTILHSSIENIGFKSHRFEIKLKTT